MPRNNKNNKTRRPGWKAIGCALESPKGFKIPCRAAPQTNYIKLSGGGTQVSLFFLKLPRWFQHAGKAETTTLEKEIGLIIFCVAYY